VAVLAALEPRQSALRTGLEILSALTYVTDLVLGAHGGGLWLVHTWSLAVEEQFYLVWPFALVALLKGGAVVRRIAVITLALALVATVSAQLAGGFTTHYTPLGAGFQLTAGAVLAVAPLRSVPRGSWIVIVAAYAFVWAVSPDPLSRALHNGPVQLFTLATMVLIVWARQYSPVVLRHPAAVWIGRRSYGLYLYHSPIIYFMAHRGLPRSQGFVIGVVLSFVLAAASYRFLEKPFLRLKDRHRALPAPR
jgi:peptidoglycan/LPS O-acetylase OafA/YrhL